ncbi:MAG: hypothetical protein H8E55_27625 [Pelagibacterales bacterium]|nr:hypothetical protein [Pelagibacterales bacterium]
MSFIVSNSFNFDETIDRLRFLQWFHFGLVGAAETTSKKWAEVSCFKVSIVSLLIHLLNETENDFASRQRARIQQHIVLQDSTMQPAGGRRQL